VIISFIPFDPVGPPLHGGKEQFISLYRPSLFHGTERTVQIAR